MAETAMVRNKRRITGIANALSEIRTALGRGLGKKVVFLLSVLGVVPLTILTIVFVLFYYQARVQGIEELQQELAEGIAADISSYLAKTEGQIQVFAQMLNLETLDPDGLERRMSAFIEQGHEYDEITVAALNGNEISKISRYYTYRDFELGSLTHRDGFQAALKKEKHIGSVVLSEFSRFPQIHITVPVVNLKDRITGVLDVGVNVAKMWSLLSKHRIGENRWAYVVDAGGHLIAHEDLSSVLQSKDLTHIRGVSTFLAGASDASRYHGINDDYVVGASAVIPLTGWGVLVEEPVHDAYSRLYSLSLVILGLSAITILAAAFLGFRFSFQQIVNPLERLRREAHAISNGRLDTHIDIDRSDEIGQLAESFNAMVQDLKRTMVSRDSLVKEVQGRKRAQEALAEREQRFRGIFDISIDAILIFNSAGIIIEANPAACHLYGYADGDLIGLSGKDIVHPDYRYLFDDFKEQVQSTGTFHAESVDVRKDGTQFDVEVRGRPFLYMNESHLLAIVRDITERKQAEADKKKLEIQLRQAQKMEAIGTLAGGIAHDFNNTLTPILVQTELARLIIGQDDPAQANLDEIMKAGHRAKDLVKQILMFSRHSEHQRLPIDLVPLVKESLKLLRSSIPTTIEIKQEIRETALVVSADPTQMQQIIMNLCTNASQAMREKGSVLEVGLEHVELDEYGAENYPNIGPGDYVRLWVSDTGIGIETGLLDKIFDPFFTTKPTGEGTGMGLSVVHGIVRSHGGEITVDSKPGDGTVFSVFLPRIDQLAESETEDRLKPVPTGNERILFVDDEEAVVRAGEKMLKRLGYQVESMTNPVDALTAFRDRPDQYDLVITDMTMPNLTGDNLAKEVIKIHSRTPVIICTGFSHRIDEQKAHNMGIRGYIMKPFVIRDLAETIREALSENGGPST